MLATPATDEAHVGDIVPTLELVATSGQRVTIPDPGGDYVHLQLRRFHAYDQWTVDELLDHAHHVPM
jgi:hypothetical protein